MVAQEQEERLGRDRGALAQEKARGTSREETAAPAEPICSRWERVFIMWSYSRRRTVSGWLFTVGEKLSID